MVLMEGLVWVTDYEKIGKSYPECGKKPVAPTKGHVCVLQQPIRLVQAARECPIPMVSSLPNSARPIKVAYHGSQFVDKYW